MFRVDVFIITGGVEDGAGENGRVRGGFWDVFREPRLVELWIRRIESRPMAATRRLRKTNVSRPPSLKQLRFRD